MESAIAKVVPSSLNHLAGEVYIELRAVLGWNRYKYDIGSESLVFEYRDINELLFFRNLIEEGRIVHDDIEIDRFSFEGSFDTFVDIGSHFGTYAAIVGVLNPDMHLVCFEPNEYNRETLAYTLAVNDIEADIRSEVVSDTTGTVSFYEEGGPGALGHSTAELKAATEVEKLSVSITDVLDEDEISKPFLKIDAEGEEYKIIRNFVEQTSFDDAAGIVSVHPDKLGSKELEEEIVSMLESNGYTCEFLDDSSRPDFPPRPEYFFSA